MTSRRMFQVSGLPALLLFFIPAVLGWFVIISWLIKGATS